MERIQVDFQKTIGPIKPMHGTGGGPKQGGAYLRMDCSAEFREIGIPFARLHDIEGPYGMMQFVDVHCIFPDFDADENDEASYNFEPTDHYLAAIVEVGTQVFYRLGETIDHFPKKLFVHPPKDAAKWARICEHIVRHYNEGWNNGFFWNITYWEIWGEPDNYRLWSGNFEQFYELYCVTATHLKRCFPSLKIGGYSASGFYTETRENCSPWFQSLVPYAIRFFDCLAKEPEKIPMDFFSWHCYANAPEEIGVFARFARGLLEKAGYSDAESILAEYNTFETLTYPPSTLPHYGADLAAGLIVAQNSPMDAMMYYDMRPHGMNGIFVRTKYWTTLERLHGFYAMRDFGDLYRLGQQCALTAEIPDVYALAATDGAACGLMIAVRGKETRRITIDMGSLHGDSVTVRESLYEQEERVYTAALSEGVLELTIHGGGIYYLAATNQ